jgi:hypothetical protein
MATPLAVGYIMAVRPYCTADEQVSINNFHYLVTAVGASPATDQDVIDQFDALIATNLKATMSSATFYHGTQGQIIAPGPAHVDVVQTLGTGPGSSGAATLPRQATGLTSWYTGLTGRKNRGRTYWPFPSAAYDTGDGKPLPAWTTLIGTLSNQILGLTAIANGGRSATIKLGIYHRQTQSTTDVINYIARGAWATQRRRGSYGRPNTPPF